jgi:hypothetical protein
MAYNHVEPTGVAPSGSGKPLTGLTVTWGVSTVSDPTYYYPFIEWRIYLNSTLIHTSTTDSLRSYSYGGTLNPSTNYTLRVDRYCRKKDIYGDAYPYYQTFSASSSFRTIEYPQAFSLTSPVNGASGLTVRPSLSWGTSTYAHGYKVYVDGALEATTASTSFTFTRDLAYSSSHSWYVQAYRTDNSGTYTTSARTFTVMAEPLPPSKSTVYAPLNNAVDIPRSQSLQWNDGITGDVAASYDIYFGTNQTAVNDAIVGSPEFKTNQSHSGIRTAVQSYSPSSLGNNTDYYWRIDSKNAQGTVKGDIWHFKTIAVQLGTPIEKVYKKKLTALADDKFWYEGDSHGLVSLGNLQIVAGDGLDLTKPVSMLAAYQKVFIVNGSNKKVVDFSNSRLTVSAISHTPARGAILTQASGAAMVIDFVDKTNKYFYGFVTNGTFAAGTASVTEDGTGYNYTITAVRNVQATPLYYNWAVYPDDADTSDIKVNGNMPKEPVILALYRGRIVMSGDRNSPHVVYMSQSTNPFNFSYTQDDAISASALSGGFAGNIGDIVTAIIPYKDDYMLIGCSQSIWLLRGDPASGGSIDQISFTVGIFDKTSFDWDSQENLYFIDANGIYKIGAGFGAVVKLTENVLPDFISEFALAPNIHRVSVQYDRKNHGILFCKSDLDTGQNQNFWFDLRTSGFFPENYPADCSAYCGCFYTADDPAYRKLLVGSGDGFIRVFEESLYKDQTSNGESAIDSFVLIGPLNINADDASAVLTQIIFNLAQESNSIEYSIYTEKTAQQCISKALDDSAISHWSGSADAGISFTIRPRIRGTYLVLKISNGLIDKTWALEKIIAQTRKAGVLR